MGIQQSTGSKKMSDEQALIAFKFPEGLVAIKRNQMKEFAGDCLASYSIHPSEDARRKIIQSVLFGNTTSTGSEQSNSYSTRSFTPDFSCALGSLLGMVIGDALGAPLEFSDLVYDSDDLKGFDHKEIWREQYYNRFRLKPGQWTDDSSMGLCLADTLLIHQGFNPLDLRLRFLNWWQFGYCNAFSRDEHRPVRQSVGLGGNISESFTEFIKDRTPYTLAGNLMTSGNGSIMRSAPVPIFYHNQSTEAESFAYKQSKTTHQGNESAECCRLLAHIIVKSIHYDASSSKESDQKYYKTKKQKVLDDLEQSFTSDLYSIRCLAAGLCEERHEDNRQLELADRCWNWKDSKFRYSKSRAEEQPGYIGSYSMDALSMALHCVYSTDDFQSALLKCANLRGDADSVCAVAGQIAGAIYGVTHIPKGWITTVQQWEVNPGDIALKAYLLFTHESLNAQTIRDDLIFSK